VKVGTQIWALITVVVVIALVAGGYFLGVAPLLQQQASADADRRAARAVNDGLEAEIAQLQLAKSDVDEYQSLASDYEELIPGKVDSQRFIRGLDALAAANGVTISELKIDEFIPYSAPVADDQFDEKAPPPYTNDRITDKNFVIVPFSLTVDGGWAESLNFVHLLQFGDRLHDRHRLLDQDLRIHVRVRQAGRPREERAGRSGGNGPNRAVRRRDALRPRLAGAQTAGGRVPPVAAAGFLLPAVP